MKIIQHHVEHFEDSFIEDWWSETRAFVVYGRGWWDRFRRRPHKITLWGEPINKTCTEFRVNGQNVVEAVLGFGAAPFAVRAVGTKDHYSVVLSFARARDAVMAKLMLGTP